MAVRLNHTVVAARDKNIAAKFLTEILGLPAPSLLGPFAVVQVCDDTSLDYHDADAGITSQHYTAVAGRQRPDLTRWSRRHWIVQSMRVATLVSKGRTVGVGSPLRSDPIDGTSSKQRKGFAIVGSMRP